VGEEKAGGDMERDIIRGSGRYSVGEAWGAEGGLGGNGGRGLALFVLRSRGKEVSLIV
jgi:hypothetical protein